MIKYYAVYRHLNAAGETLYIGCSSNPFMRFAGHLSKSSWVTDVVGVEIQWFQSRDEALREEKRLILAERPPNNRLEFPQRRYERPQTNGPRMLAEWMARNAVDDARLAKALGITKSQAKSLLSPKAAPLAKRRFSISAVTSGEVPSTAWSALRPASAASPQDAIEAKEFLMRSGVPVPPPIIPITGGSQ